MTLTPHVIVSAIESIYDFELDGMLTAYPSYVNRVYGVHGWGAAARDAPGETSGTDYIAKFYRPGRWESEAIEEEHRYVADCARFDVPVVAPLANPDGDTIHNVIAESGDVEQEFSFALYPKRGGRSFDAETDDDWLRLGGLVGRIHTASLSGSATCRLVCTPQDSTAGFLAELQQANLVHPEVRDEFFATAKDALEWIGPLFDGVQLQRIHGDCHRGNILDRPGEGLLIIDFDDMMIGPAVQDLWLLLPDRAHAARRELNLVLEGYERFQPFDPATLQLIEPLRLMRMLYYLAWSARQRHDHRFQESFPQWGSKAFWEKELEDLHTQIAVIRDELEAE